MNWTYEIKPVFLAECKRIAFPLLEQLIRNYLKGSKERTIKLQFDDEFDQFWEYFKNKKDIISRIVNFGSGIFIALDSFFKGFINENNTMDKIPEANYKFFYVDSFFDNKIFDFVKTNNIECLFIKKGGNTNLKDFFNCEKIQFVFDNLTKTFLFRINGNLQAI